MRVQDGELFVLPIICVSAILFNEVGKFYPIPEFHLDLDRPLFEVLILVHHHLTSALNSREVLGEGFRNLCNKSI